MELDAELLARLDTLRQQFAAGLPRRLDAIDVALAACRADAANPAALSALLTALHSLAGAAGIFGFAELGEQARAAEQHVAGWIEQGCDAAGLDAMERLAGGWRIAA